jgi:hypothetical protein
MAMFAETPPMDAIVSRAHFADLDAIGARLSCNLLAEAGEIPIWAAGLATNPARMAIRNYA